MLWLTVHYTKFCIIIKVQKPNLWKVHKMFSFIFDLSSEVGVVISTQWITENLQHSDRSCIATQWLIMYCNTVTDHVLQHSDWSCIATQWLIMYCNTVTDHVLQHSDWSCIATQWLIMYCNTVTDHILQHSDWSCIATQWLIMYCYWVVSRWLRSPLVTINNCHLPHTVPDIGIQHTFLLKRTSAESGKYRTLLLVD